MTSQVLLRSFDSEGPRAHHEWAMSMWPSLNPLHAPAKQSNFGDLTSGDVHWPFDDRSCFIVELFLSSSHQFSSHHYLYTVYDSLWYKFYHSSV